MFLLSNAAPNAAQLTRSRSPQVDSWVDHEISSLLETVESGTEESASATAETAGTRRTRRRPARRGYRKHGLVLRLRLSLGRRRTDLLYYAVAIVLSAFVGWLATFLLEP
jgi:hypothetical protein